MVKEGVASAVHAHYHAGDTTLLGTVCYAINAGVVTADGLHAVLDDMPRWPGAPEGVPSVEVEDCIQWLLQWGLVRLVDNQLETVRWELECVPGTRDFALLQARAAWRDHVVFHDVLMGAIRQGLTTRADLYEALLGFPHHLIDGELQSLVLFKMVRQNGEHFEVVDRA